MVSEKSNTRSLHPALCEQYYNDAVRQKKTGTAKNVMENEEIIGFEALYESMNKCRKGVLWKESVAHYFLNGIEETYKLSKELKNGTYQARKTTKFTITRPKKREIVSVCFRDRVYQRSLNDNAIYPVMTSSFIRDNWACQKNKGTDDARERLKVFLRRMYRKYGNDFYVLQIDIHGYYPNMRHDIVRAVFKEKLSEEIFERAMRVLDGQYSSDVGYNPGSQMVQIAGISLTNNHDHKIKEQLRPDEFGRYMDDSILLHSSEKVLNNFKNEISKMLEEIGMEFNPKKTKVFSVKNGFTFLGFKYRITDTGKIIMTVDSKNVKERRRKLRKLVKKAKRGEISKEIVDQSYKSWRNHASKGNSYKLITRMDRFYKDLWKGDRNAN